MYSAVWSDQVDDGQAACRDQHSTHSQHHEAQRESSTSTSPQVSYTAMCNTLLNKRQNGVSKHRL